MLEDVLDSEEPFGAITTLFAGDFRQCLPVVKKGTPGQVAAACITRASFWPQVTVLRLKTNMRLLAQVAVLDDEEAELTRAFATRLLGVGDGSLNERSSAGRFTDMIKVDEQLLLPPQRRTRSALIASIYPDITRARTEEEQLAYFGGRAILAARNIDVDSVNNEILDSLPGEARVFLSTDEIQDEKDAHTYPVEYLNTITIPGLPLHRTILKVGAPLMLLRNLDPSSGLCNGTRLLTTRLSNRVIEARIFTGDHAGEAVFIPRIGIDSSDLAFTLRRTQFPVRLAGAVTINKSQGQSLEHVGVYLSTPVFTHGQFYVAMSRATNWRNIRVLLDDGEEAGKKGLTYNVVFRDVLKQGR